MSYAEFVKEAMQCYQTLPNETNDLYKKYSVAIPLSEAAATKTGSSTDAEKFAAMVSEKTRLKFDAIISDTFAKSMNNAVRIIKSSEADESILSERIFKSGEDKFAAYVNAYSIHTVLIESPANSEQRLNILFVNSGNLTVQVLLKLQEHSKLKVSEIYASDSVTESTLSVLHEISAEKSSRLELNALHNENENTSILNLCKGNAIDGAKISANYVYCGGTATKARNIMDSKGIGSSVDVTEFAYGAKSQNFDLNTTIINSTPYSITNLTSGVVLDDSSKCMLKGYARVNSLTKGANSKITERGILMSKDAHIDALPDMTIDYSNEVKATHSASTSPIDQEALFYLTSRGLDEEKAKKIFIAAFIAKYVSRIDDPAMKEIAMSVMLDKLETKAFGTISEITPRNIWIAENSKK